MDSNLESLNSHQSFDGVNLIESTLLGWEKKIHTVAGEIVLKLQDEEKITTLDDIKSSFLLQSLGVRANSMSIITPGDLVQNRNEVVQDLLIIGCFFLNYFYNTIIVIFVTYNILIYKYKVKKWLKCHWIEVR